MTINALLELADQGLNCCHLSQYPFSFEQSSKQGHYHSFKKQLCAVHDILAVKNGICEFRSLYFFSLGYGIVSYKLELGVHSSSIRNK